MPSEIEAIYQRSIRSLPPTERLQLATLILNDLVQQDRDVVDDSDAWTEDDLRDITNFSLQCAEERYPQYGSDEGKVWMSDDFDEPLEDFREYMT